MSGSVRRVRGRHRGCAPRPASRDTFPVVRRPCVADALEPRMLLAVSPLGPEFPVNTTTANAQSAPAMAMDADGDFVVAWESFGQDGSDLGVYARRYTAAGVPVGGEFRVNTHTASVQSSPAVAMDADGDFVIVWDSLGQDGALEGIYAQRYNAAGALVGGEFRVNTRTAGTQRVPSVAMDADGDFVVAWESGGQDGSSVGIYGQRYSANEAPTTLGIAAVTVQQDEADTLIGLFPLFADSTDPDPLLAFSVVGNTNPGLFSSTLIGSATGTLTLDYAPAQGGQATLTVRATDTAGLFVQTSFNVTVITSTGLQVAASEFLYQTAPHRLRVTFNRDVNPGTFQPSDLSIRRLPNDAPFTATAVAYGPDPKTVTFTLPGPPLEDGNYRATLTRPGVLAQGYSTDFFIMAGDANHDRSVGFADLVTVAQNYGQGNKTFVEGDFNYDGAVGFADLVMLAQRYGTTLPAAGAIAAPSPVELQAQSARRPSGDRVFNAHVSIRKPPVVKPVKRALARETSQVIRN